MVPYGSLWVLNGPYKPLYVTMRRYGSLWVLKGSY